MKEQKEPKGKVIGSPYQDYYILTEDNKVYNTLNKRYLRANNKMYKLVNKDNKRVNATLKEIYYNVHNKIYCIDDIENLPDEQWKEIDASGGNYLISSAGRIKSYKGYYAKLLTVTTTAKGYKRVSINFDGIQKNYFVHRLVAEYFLPAPEMPLCVLQIHHKDFNPSNNRADNLIWTTKEEHVKMHKARK